MAIEAGEKFGYTMETYTVSQSSEIQQVVESMVGKIDALYIPIQTICLLQYADGFHGCKPGKDPDNLW